MLLFEVQFCDAVDVFAGAPAICNGIASASIGASVRIGTTCRHLIRADLSRIHQKAINLQYSNSLIKPQGVGTGNDILLYGINISLVELVTCLLALLLCGRNPSIGFVRFDLDAFGSIIPKDVKTDSLANITQFHIIVAVDHIRLHGGKCAIHKNLIVAEIGKNAGSVCNAAAKHDCADNHAGKE